MQRWSVNKTRKDGPVEKSTVRRRTRSLAVNPLIIKPFFQAELIEIVLDPIGIFVGRGTQIDPVFGDVERIPWPPEIDSKGFSIEPLFAPGIDVDLVCVGESSHIDRKKVEGGIDIGPGCHPPY